MKRVGVFVATGVVVTGALVGVSVLATQGQQAPVPRAADGQFIQGLRAGAAACEYPSQVLDLSNWKIQLPIGQEEDPDEVTQPELDGYRVEPWFVPTPACDGVRFRSAVDGVTTGGSDYPRSELREMNGAEEASWSSTSGTHSMTIDQTVTHLPNDKQHLVVGQIHGGDDDVSVFRVEGTSLYVTNGDDPHYQLVTDDFRLNTRFQVRFEVADGTINAFYNGRPVATLDADFSTGYFKAGAYTQANCSNSSPCDASNYGETIVHKVALNGSAPPPSPPSASESPPPPTNTPPPSTPPAPAPPTGEQPAPPPIENPAPRSPLPIAQVAASGHDGNEPANTLDGDRSTRWSDEGDGVWIGYDLGGIRKVGSVRLAWHKGDTRHHSFQIRTSTDGTNWTTGFTGTSGGTTLGPETYDIPDTTARYVLVIGFGNTGNDWTSITETGVYPA
ncbi:MAG TPA: polysaccharide lyase family 7 protein [Actinophytocola sp.]|nr:polysaccharide lyase family 7 protein [Actinophytocola sp.]